MKRLMILSSLLAVAAPIASSWAEEVPPYPLPYEQRYQPARIEPAAPQPLADAVKPRVNFSDLLAQVQRNEYARSQFVMGRRLIRLSQTGL